MRAEIVSIGDELTSGQRLDTNSQWLSQRLGELGISVVAHVTVADDLAINIEAYRHAVDRADIVISTGGLGPTADDLTREVLAQLAGKELKLDTAALEHIRGMFARRKREMPERNVVQAMFPEGSRIIPNPEGTAPGVDIDIPRLAGGKSRVFALPGVPAEMKQMWERTVAPALLAMSDSPTVIRHARVKCFGVGESALEQMLPDLIRRGRDPSVGITVHEGTITLRMTTARSSGPECYAAMDETLQTIHDCLGGLVFGYEDDELQHTVLKLLKSTGKTLAVMEWGTRGLVTSWLGDVPGYKEQFLGGTTILAGEAIGDVFELPEEASPEHAELVLKQIAEQVRDRWNVDYALAVGDIPGRDTAAGASGEITFALAGPETTQIKTTPAASHSAIVKPLAAKAALNMVRLALMPHVAR